MTKLTTELLEKFVSDIKTDGMCDITDHQVESALIQLLAYEQAADRPVGEIFRCSGNKTLRWWNDVPEGTVLYAAPVLPKQPEHSRQHFESLCNQFWNWAEFDEINQDEEPRLEWNGSNYTHRVTAALWKMYQAAPAQPVIPDSDDSDLIQRLSGRVQFLRDKGEVKTPELIEAAISALAAQAAIPKWPSDEVERDALRYRFLRDSDFFGDEDEPSLVSWKELFELSYNEFDAAVDARIAHPDIDYVKLDTELRKHIPVQPVSEPYKLNGWISVDEKMPEDGDAAPAQESE